VAALTSHIPPSPTLLVKVAIWAALLLTLFTGAALADGDAPALAPPLQPVAVEQLDVQEVEELTPGDPQLAEFGYTSENSTVLLPAWRWRTSFLLESQSGINNVTTPMASFIASAFFFVSALLWWALTGLVHYAMTMDVVEQAAFAINQTFATFADTLGGSGIVWFLLVATVLVAIRVWMRTQNSGSLVRIILIFIVPVATMQGLASTAGDATTGNPLPTGSPAWIAHTGSSMINEVGGNLGSGFGLLAASGSAASSPLEMATAEPSCASYIDTLHTQYVAHRNDGPGDETVLLENRADEAVITVSNLWQRSFLANWTAAQYGSEIYGSRLYCHQLEHNVRAPAAEQATLGALAGWPANPSLDIFRMPSDAKEREPYLFHWAACAHTGAWGPTDGWEQVGGLTAGDCASWWSDGDVGGGAIGRENLRWNRQSQLDSDIDVTGANAADEEAIFAVQETVESYWGHNSGGRFLNGLFSIFTAMVYMWALGGLALGAIIAQLGLVILLMLLPATILLLAIPSKQGRQHQAGPRLLKLTLGFMAAKLALVVTITLLLQSVTVLQNLVALTTGAGSATGMLFHLIIPVVAVFIVRKVLKTLGVGDLTKISGAIGMSSAVAAAASGDQGRVAAGFDRAGKAVSRTTGASKAKQSLKSGAKATFADAFNSSRSTLAELTTRANDRWALRDRASRAIPQMADASGEKTTGRTRDALWAQIRKLDQGRDGDHGRLTMPGAAHLAAAAHAPKRVARAEHNEQLVAQRRARITAASSATKADRNARREALFSATDKQLRRGHLAADAAIEQGGGYEGFDHLRFDDHQKAVLGQGDPVQLTPDQRLARRAHYAAGMGVDEKQVLTPGDGLPPIVAPTAGSYIQASTPEATRKLLAHPVNHLSPELARPVQGESEQARAWRVQQYLVAAGYVGTDGQPVDVAALHGIDLDTAEGQLEAERALTGDPSAFDQVTITLPTSAKASIDAHARNLDLETKQNQTVTRAQLWPQIEATLDTSRSEANTATRTVREEAKGLADTVRTLSTTAAEDGLALSGTERSQRINELLGQLPDLAARVSGQFRAALTTVEDLQVNARILETRADLPDALNLEGFEEIRARLDAESTAAAEKFQARVDRLCNDLRDAARSGNPTQVKQLERDLVQHLATASATLQDRREANLVIQNDMVEKLRQYDTADELRQVRHGTQRPIDRGYQLVRHLPPPPAS